MKPRDPGLQGGGPTLLGDVFALVVKEAVRVSHPGHSAQVHTKQLTRINYSKFLKGRKAFEAKKGPPRIINRPFVILSTYDRFGCYC
jgi:hypothetical protein